MKATGKDAFNLIRHWKDEGSQLRCTCASEGPGFRLTGRVAEPSDSVLSITGTGCEALIPLDGVPYDYHGSQDIPSALEKSLDGKFVSVLELSLRNGNTVVMAEGANRLVAGGTATASGRSLARNLVQQSASGSMEPRRRPARRLRTV